MSEPMEAEEDEVEEGAAWMATFADLSTLLLTFFILMLSFANMDVDEFRSALGSVRDALGVKNDHPGHIMGLTTSVVEMSTKESTPNIEILDEVIERKMQEAIKSRGVEGEVKVDRSERGVVVRVDDRVLFAPGKAKLRKRASKALDVISGLAREIAVPLWIEGHTDNRSIKTLKYPSNWELSAARAAAVLRYIAKTGGIDRKRIRIAGYADTRPLQDNRTAKGRAANRRVEFVFVKPKGREAQERLLKALEYLKAEAESAAAAPNGQPKAEETKARLDIDDGVKPTPGLPALAPAGLPMPRKAAKRTALPRGSVPALAGPSP